MGSFRSSIKTTRLSSRRSVTPIKSYSCKTKLSSDTASLQLLMRYGRVSRKNR